MLTNLEFSEKYHINSICILKLIKNNISENIIKYNLFKINQNYVNA